MVFPSSSQSVPGTADADPAIVPVAVRFDPEAWRRLAGHAEESRLPTRARVASGWVAESSRARSMRQLPRLNISLVECEPDDTAYVRARRLSRPFPSRIAALRRGWCEPR